MPVTVEHSNLNLKQTAYFNGESWSVDDKNNLNIRNNNGLIGTHEANSWSSVKKGKQDDIQLKLEEALELISLVDSGKFSNQDSDWRERAEDLLS